MVLFGIAKMVMVAGSTLAASAFEGSRARDFAASNDVIYRAVRLVKENAWQKVCKGHKCELCPESRPCKLIRWRRNGKKTIWRCFECHQKSL